MRESRKLPILCISIIPYSVQISDRHGDIQMDITQQTIQDRKVQHIFIIGAKSIGQYGGFESFVDKLTEQHAGNHEIKYHIACKANGEGYMDEKKLTGVENLQKDRKGNIIAFLYHNAHVFKIKCPNIGPAVAIYYDQKAVKYAIRYCREQGISAPIFYILTCRIGFILFDVIIAYRKVYLVAGMIFLAAETYKCL